MAVVTAVIVTAVMVMAVMVIAVMVMAVMVMAVMVMAKTQKAGSEVVGGAFPSDGAGSRAASGGYRCLTQKGAFPSFSVGFDRFGFGFLFSLPIEAISSAR